MFVNLNKLATRDSVPWLCLFQIDGALPLGVEIRELLRQLRLRSGLVRLSRRLRRWRLQLCHPS